MSTHTPTPWTAERNGGKGAWIKGADGEWSGLSCGTTDANADANADLIVKAVNSHGTLIAALKDTRAAFRVEYIDGRVSAVSYDDKALRPLIAMLDVVLAGVAAP